MEKVRGRGFSPALACRAHPTRKEVRPVSIMARNHDTPLGEPPSLEQLQAIASDRLERISKTRVVRERREAVAWATLVAKMPPDRIARKLGIAWNTVKTDIAAVHAEGITGELPPPAPEITYTCHICEQEIARRTGYIYCLYDDIRAVGDYLAKEDEIKDPERLSDLFARWDLAPRAHWRAVHDACLEDPDAYDISVGQIDTAAGLLTWQNHLWEKNWFPHTEWDVFLSDYVIPSLRRKGASSAVR